MKSQNVVILFILLGISLGSCLSTREIIVESDFSYIGDFKRYKTFTFLNHQKNELDSIVPDDIIKTAISNRMELLGYKEDTQNPNLIVGYKLYFKDFNFQGYTQPELEVWIKDPEYYKETYEPLKYNLKEGTLIIFLIDRKQNKAIWQGYNSGVLDLTTVTSERYVRGSVRMIFDRFRVFADGYLKQS